MVEDGLGVGTSAERTAYQVLRDRPPRIRTGTAGPALQPPVKLGEHRRRGDGRPDRTTVPGAGAGRSARSGTGMASDSLSGPGRGPHTMIIDRETFTELAVHLKLASDAILKTARHLAVLSNGDSSNEEQWAGTLDSLMAMNSEITVMEKILRALMEANREEETPSPMVPDKKSEPLPS